MNVSMTSYSPTTSSMSGSQPPPPPPSDESGAPSTEDLLSFLDSDGDGELSSEEISADSALSNVISDDVFASADADGNGSLSAEELETTRPDGPPPPPPGGGQSSASSTSGVDAASLFESLAEAASTDSTIEFPASIESALTNAQSTYDLMQDLFASAAA